MSKLLTRIFERIVHSLFAFTPLRVNYHFHHLAGEEDILFARI